MIKFNSFISSIHAAILSANDALADKNLDVLEKFFEVSDGNIESQRTSRTTDDALTAINDVLNQKGTPGKQRLQTVLGVLEKVRETLSQDDISGADSDQAKAAGGLRAKMVTIQYPEKTASGVVMVDVSVPLITLVPLSMTQISEVKFRTELEIQVEGDDLLVGFPAAQSGLSDEQKADAPRLSPQVTTLEVTLTPHHGTEGLRKIVEGYEKVLRSQIP